eukprot:g22373.t1
MVMAGAALSAACCFPVLLCPDLWSILLGVAGVALGAGPSYAMIISMAKERRPGGLTSIDTAMFSIASSLGAGGVPFLMSRASTAMEQPVPGIVWTYWEQGWEHAPSLCQDGTEHEKFGGLWVDATLFCSAPVMPWLQALKEGGSGSEQEGFFFVFDRSQSKSWPCDPFVDCELWMLGPPGRHPLTSNWLAALRLEFCKAEVDYFCAHHSFRQMVQASPEAMKLYQEVPKVSARHPHLLEFELGFGGRETEAGAERLRQALQAAPLCPEGLRALEAYGGRKIAVVSVCGPSNSGKSYLLNVLLGRVEESLPAFKVGTRRTGSCTDGLWLWAHRDRGRFMDHETLAVAMKQPDTTSVLTQPQDPDDENAPILAYLDCAGFGVSDRSCDGQLMTLCALMSSVMILNTKEPSPAGTLGEAVFNSLACVTRLAEHLQERGQDIRRPRDPLTERSPVISLWW